MLSWLRLRPRAGVAFSADDGGLDWYEDASVCADENAESLLWRLGGGGVTLNPETISCFDRLVKTKTSAANE